MSQPRSPFDPDGHYARLGVSPDSGPRDITAAYRRAARLVHPDVPGSGNAAAFMAVKQAYDVLIQPDRRAAYDQAARWSATLGTHDSSARQESARQESARQESARGQAWREPDGEPGEIDPMPAPEVPAPPTRHPRLRDLPATVWAGMAALLALAAIETGLHLTAAPAPGHAGTVPALARDVPPTTTADPAPATFGPAPVRLAGVANYYTLPAASPTTLWRQDDARHGLVPWGQLPPFSAVHGLRLRPDNGMVEVKVTESANGFIDAARLTPGDTAAAVRAWCTFHAGLAPETGEVLSHAGEGHGRVEVENRAGQAAVVKLRTSDGAVAASVFLALGGRATLDRLPEERVTVEFATGEVWSRACRGFTAGMRAQMLAGGIVIGQTRQVAVPPETGTAPEELPDPMFERE